MNERDRQLQVMLSRAQKQADGRVPPFADSFAAARRTSESGSRRRFMALGTAAAVFAVAVGLMNRPAPEMAYVDVDAFMSTTGWTAPSDALLPTHSFDIYHEIPRLIESTESIDGALL